MNIRRIIKILAALIALGMVLCPPWMEVYSTESGAFSREYYGYHAVWNKPAMKHGKKSQKVRIFSDRLAKQLVGVGFSTMALLFIVGRVERRKSE